MKTQLSYTITGVLVAIALGSSWAASAQSTAPAGVKSVQQQTAPSTPHSTPPVKSDTMTPPVQTPDAQTAPDTSTSVASTDPTAPGQAPKDFIREAYLANEFGIAASQVALTNAKSADTKAAAKQIISDGTKVRTDLIAAVQGATTDMHFDQSWTDDYKQKLANLKDAKGADFDQKYLEVQGEVNEKATNLFSSFASTGTDATVKTFAANTLPVLQSEGDKLDAAGQGGN